MSLFLCLSSILLGQYCRKRLTKSGGFGKKDKNGGDGDIGGLSLGGGFKPSTHYGLWSCFSILCIFFQMNSINFAYNIWLQIMSLLVLHPPNWHLHPQPGSGVFCWQLSGSLIFRCQTSWPQSCNQIMHVEQSMMGSHCDGMMRLVNFSMCEDIHVQFCQ